VAVGTNEKHVMREKKIIGRRDKVNLPGLHLSDVDVKIDTGAYGNALHCHKMEEIEENGTKRLRFKVLDPTHPEYKKIDFYSEDYRLKKVKNSGGIAELRYVIKTSIMLFGKTYITEFSLTNRKKMKHPILIGRKFLSGKFLVDVKMKNLSYTHNQPTP
jgi:hypothetical protein